MGAERNHRRQVAHDTVEHVLADDGERHAGRGEVLLRTAVNHGVFRNVDRAGKDVRRHVGDQGHGRSEVFVVLGAVDRIVGGDMHIVQIGRDRETLGDVGEIAVFGRSEQLDLAVTLSFLDGLLGPDTGIHIACLPAQEVGGHFVEERAGTAADIEDLVVVGDAEQLTEERVGLGHHVLEILRPVRNRKQGKARTVEIYDSFCCVLDDFVCEDRGSALKLCFFIIFGCEFSVSDSSLLVY